jgi:hypothetical protein
MLVVVPKEQVLAVKIEAKKIESSWVSRLSPRNFGRKNRGGQPVDGLETVWP